MFVVGDKDVGKASIMIGIDQDKEELNNIKKIDLSIKHYKVEKEMDALGKLKLSVFVTADKKAVKRYSILVDVVIIVYDVGNRKSFVSIGEWMKRVRREQASAKKANE